MRDNILTRSFHYLIINTSYVRKANSIVRHLHLFWTCLVKMVTATCEWVLLYLCVSMFMCVWYLCTHVCWNVCVHVYFVCVCVCVSPQVLEDFWQTSNFNWQGRPWQTRARFFSYLRRVFFYLRFLCSAWYSVAIFKVNF